MNQTSTFLQQNNRTQPDWHQSPEIIALSASTHSALEQKISAFIESLPQLTIDDNLQDVAANTRASFSKKDQFRLLFVVEPSDNIEDTCKQAIDGLKKNNEKNCNVKNIYYGENNMFGKLGFIFPGQGSQYVFMGKDLIYCFPETRQVLTQANEVYNKAPLLSDIIYPEQIGIKNEKTTFEEALRSTDIAQPSIGAISLAMMTILQRFNIAPDATCGHSYGELSALCAAGWIDEPAFLTLSVARGKYMAEAAKGTDDKGSMLAVKAPLDQIDKLIKTSGSDVILANRNSPDQGVLSGSTDAILNMKSICADNKIRAMILPVAAAFHSRLVKDAAEPFQKEIESFDFSKSSIPVYSNTTGTPYPDTQKEIKKLLGRHLLQPVHFIEEIENMYHAGIQIFVEVGPKGVLTGLVKSILKGRSVYAMGVDASSGRKSGITDLAKTLCHLSSIGYPVDICKWRQP